MTTQRDQKTGTFYFLLASKVFHLRKSVRKNPEDPDRVLAPCFLDLFSPKCKLAFSKSWLLNTAMLGCNQFTVTESRHFSVFAKVIQVYINFFLLSLKAL